MCLKTLQPQHCYVINLYEPFDEIKEVFWELVKIIPAALTEYRDKEVQMSGLRRGSLIYPSA